MDVANQVSSCELAPVTYSLMICSHTSSLVLTAFSSDLIHGMSYVLSATMNSWRMLSKAALRQSIHQHFSLCLLESAASSTVCPAKHVPLPRSRFQGGRMYCSK